MFGASYSIASEAEYISSEKPAPTTVKEAKDSIPKGLEEKEKKEPARFPTLKQKFKSLQPFFRDTELKINFRTYYRYKDLEEVQISEAWALGGYLAYKSGWYKDRIQIGAVGYTSQKLYGPEDRAETQLLKPIQESFSVLGQAYLKARILNGLELRVFRQSIDVPYINKDDSRMVPNTFEAYALVGKEIQNTSFHVAQVTKMKKRDSSEFVYMSEAAGIKDTEEGVTMAGISYFGENAKIGILSQYAWELWNTIFAETNAVFDLTDQVGLKVSAQYTDQRSVGDELDGDFSTYAVGGRVALGYQGGILTLAYTSTDNDSKTRNPFGGHPDYTALMVKDFNRAGEDAWLAGLSFDFSKLGVEGLSAFAKYAHGNTPDSGTHASPDQEELDLTVDYKINEGELKGLWLRLRAALLNQSGQGANDVEEFRIILNFPLQIL